MYWTDTSLDGMMPINGNSTNGSSDVTGIGSASVIQKIAIINIT